MPFSFSSFISFSSSVSHNGRTEEKRWAYKHESGPSGTTIRTASMRTGEPMCTERRDYDASGRPIPQGRVLHGGGSVNTIFDRRFEDVSEQEESKSS
ncbi:cytochrome P450 protein [Colletotrichum tofieldiae]|uniref:Cytochrome P450 protein n=1 Tax=Colletotrichum tofieldiae TaxID=708197 RepID=A0A161Y477_9PEZI|nr:cytochrome P450 protein [Colletotrichum tofieldiae]GKT66364.1 cytochrome P450 protein [Colletotrichum tofieldiae]GKT82080.1 cytochrome P450 protein [Colletotrichum tofieldiae]GKT95416.1 cytochrome P450 protein [Colletotrichum tofieldiae]